MRRANRTVSSQARVPVGDHNLPEIPAGMLDGKGDFKGVAADEIQEECHIVISKDELVRAVRWSPLAHAPCPPLLHNLCAERRAGAGRRWT